MRNPIERMTISALFCKSLGSGPELELLELGNTATQGMRNKVIVMKISEALIPTAYRAFIFFPRITFWDITVFGFDFSGINLTFFGRIKKVNIKNKTGIPIAITEDRNIT